MRKDSVPDEPHEEIFRLVSRIKYPQGTPPKAGQGKTNQLTSLGDGFGTEPVAVEIVTGRDDMRASMRAIVEKYSLSELTLATEDGLVFATSADRDVQSDAVKYSQIFRHQAPPDEPDISLFDLLHRESRLIGIIRTPHELPQNWKRQIRDDTKVILQWWL